VNSLQKASQLIERIEASARIYRAARSEEDLHTAQRTAALRSRNVTALEILVADNGRQTASITALETCSSHLLDVLANYQTSDPMPTEDLSACRQSVGLMTDQEKLLLEERGRIYGIIHSCRSPPAGVTLHSLW
jgi:hypothetical protein